MKLAAQGVQTLLLRKILKNNEQQGGIFPNDKPQEDH